MFFDLSQELLPRYQSEQQDPEDFDAFWSETIAGCASRPAVPGGQMIDQKQSIAFFREVLGP